MYIKVRKELDLATLCPKDNSLNSNENPQSRTDEVNIPPEYDNRIKELTLIKIKEQSSFSIASACSFIVFKKLAMVTQCVAFGSDSFSLRISTIDSPPEALLQY